jgi:predicted HTH transcriptional regulator
MREYTLIKNILISQEGWTPTTENHISPLWDEQNSFSQSLHRCIEKLIRELEKLTNEIRINLNDNSLKIAHMLKELKKNDLSNPMLASIL